MTNKIEYPNLDLSVVKNDDCYKLLTQQIILHITPKGYDNNTLEWIYWKYRLIRWHQSYSAQPGEPNPPSIYAGKRFLRSQASAEIDTTIRNYKHALLNNAPKYSAQSVFERI